MQVSYENRKIEKICTEKKAAQKELGQNVKFLSDRLDDISAVANLEELRHYPGHYHELIGDRKGQIACSIVGKLRLIFKPDHEPVPVKPDGGLDWSQVTAVKFIETDDYHK